MLPLAPPLIPPEPPGPIRSYPPVTFRANEPPMSLAPLAPMFPATIVSFISAVPEPLEYIPAPRLAVLPLTVHPVSTVCL